MRAVLLLLMQACSAHLSQPMHLNGRPCDGDVLAVAFVWFFWLCPA